MHGHSATRDDSPVGRPFSDPRAHRRPGVAAVRAPHASQAQAQAQAQARCPDRRNGRAPRRLEWFGRRAHWQKSESTAASDFVPGMRKAEPTHNRERKGRRKEETERRSPATPAARRSGLDAFCHARLLREGAQTPVDREMLSSAIGRPDTPRRSVKPPRLTNPGSRKLSSRSRRSKTISRPRSRSRSPAKWPHVRPEQLDHGQRIETRLSPRRQAVGQWQLEPHRRWRESRKWQLFRSPCVTLHIAASPTLRSLYSGRREAQQDETAHT